MRMIVTRGFDFRFVDMIWRKMRSAICLDNKGYEASLELRKIYQMSSPESNDPKGYIRVVDESGEDYLYRKKGFELIDLPQRTERKLLATLRWMNLFLLTFRAIDNKHLLCRKELSPNDIRRC